MKKRMILGLTICALLALCFCTIPSNDGTLTPGQATASPSPSPLATAEPTQAPPSAQEMEVIGTVISHTGDAVAIKTADGRQLEFNTAGADAADAPDIVTGCTLTVTYTGEIAGQDASGAQVLALHQDPEEQHATGTIALFDGREISLQLGVDQYLRFSIEGVDLSLATNLEAGQRATVFYVGEGEERQILRLAQ